MLWIIIKSLVFQMMPSTQPQPLQLEQEFVLSLLHGHANSTRRMTKYAIFPLV